MSAINSVLREILPPSTSVAGRLERLLGTGSNPRLRRALYTRLDRLCQEPASGQQIYEVVATVASDATTKNDPGRWFAHAVLERLKDKGFIARASI